MKRTLDELERRTGGKQGRGSGDVGQSVGQQESKPSKNGGSDCRRDDTVLERERSLKKHRGGETAEIRASWVEDKRRGGRDKTMAKVNVGGCGKFGSQGKEEARATGYFYAEKHLSYLLGSKRIFCTEDKIHVEYLKH